MANSLGALTVLLGLDASEYTRGLSKAELQAQQFARNTRSAILEVGKILGTLKLGDVVLENTKAIISEAAALDNLSGSLGSSVESLSRLTNQAKIAGTDFATLQNAALKLSAGMAGADDESTKVKEALRILGVTTKDPVQALQEVAVKLNSYADGVNKVGFAVALFGKQGGQFLSTLKDIAELQDVGATITAKQAAEANNLEKEFRRLSVEAEGFKNLLLSGVVPALRDMIAQFTEGIRVAGGFFNAMNLFGQINVGDLPAETKRITAALEHAQEVGERNKAVFGDPDFFGGDKARANLQKQLEYLQALARARGLASISSTNNDVRDIIAQRKPTAPNPPSSGAGGKAIKDTISDTERYIKSLEEQQQATLDLNAVDLAQIKIYELSQNVLSGLTEARKAQILDIAEQIKFAKEAAEAERLRVRAEEEAARIRERNSQALTRQIEAEQKHAESLREGNESIREEIIGIKGGEAALLKYIQAKNEAVAVELEQKAAMLANVEGSEQLAQAFIDQARALRERNQLLSDKNLAEQLKKEAQALQDVKNMFSDTFATAFSDFISGTKSAKDAFKSFVDDLARQITRIASQNLANALFGGNNASGPDFFGVLAKLFGGFAGAGGAAGGIGAGGSGGLAFAAAGTPYARGGWTMVGENGIPELVNLPPGASVKPANYSSARGAGWTVNQTINVMPGATTQSSRQAAGMARDAVMRAVRDR